MGELSRIDFAGIRTGAAPPTQVLANLCGVRAPFVANAAFERYCVFPLPREGRGIGTAKASFSREKGPPHLPHFARRPLLVG